MNVADIDAVIEALRGRQPRLVVKPAADDGLWFVRDVGSDGSRPHCQLESGSHDLPFLVESDDHACVAITCDETVAIVEAILAGQPSEVLTRTRVRPIATPEEALSWLTARGARPWLVRHHELVLEAATELVDATTAALAVKLDRPFVLLGAALHDAGKMIHPAEMSAPGHRHEDAGSALLAYGGFGPVSRVAVTHARWSERGATMDDRFVALADKLWKGKREAALEDAVVDELARLTHRERWEVFGIVDEIYERVASAGPDRLARSVV